MNELALFSGAGGGILGGKLLGWQTVCAVEIDAYCASVLIQRQNDGILPPFPIWDDVCTFDGKPWTGIVDVVSGGFPCQDISAAGKGAGIEGEKSALWVEMARIIGEIRPRYVWVENSPMLTSRGLGVVLGDLAAMGFDARWGIVGAADVGAPHLRERIWIVADASSGRCNRESGREVQQQRGAEAIGTSKNASNIDSKRELQPEGRKQKKRGRSCDGDIRNAEGIGRRTGRARGSFESTEGASVKERAFQTADIDMPRQERPKRGEKRKECAWRAVSYRSDWWDIEPDVVRVVSRVPAGVDRIKALGNAQVPAVAATAWKILTGD